MGSASTPFPGEHKVVKSILEDDLGIRWKTKRNQNKITSRIRREISRIQIHLSASLDEILTYNEIMH